MRGKTKSRIVRSRDVTRRRGSSWHGGVEVGNWLACLEPSYINPKPSYDNACMVETQPNPTVEEYALYELPLLQADLVQRQFESLSSLSIQRSVRNHILKQLKPVFQVLVGFCSLALQIKKFLTF
jgi:hypothetical protein